MHFPRGETIEFWDRNPIVFIRVRIRVLESFRTILPSRFATTDLGHTVIYHQVRNCTLPNSPQFWTFARWYSNSTSSTRNCPSNKSMQANARSVIPAQVRTLVLSKCIIICELLLLKLLLLILYYLLLYYIFIILAIIIFYYNYIY